MNFVYRHYDGFGDYYPWVEPSITYPTGTITYENPKPSCFKPKNPCRCCMYRENCESYKE